MAGSYVVYVAATETNEGFVVMVEPDAGEVRSPMSSPEKPEFGVYKSKLPSDRFDRLVKAIEAAGPAPLGNDEEMAAGDLVASFGIMDGDQARVLHGYPVAQPPPELKKAIEILDEVAAEIMGHPHRVLRGKVTWAKRAFRVGEDIRGELTLEARGTESVTVRSPTAAPDEQPPDVTLVLYRTDPDGTPQPFRELRFRAGDVRPKGTENGPPPGGGNLSLGKGESRTFSFGASIRLGPGSYPTYFRFTSEPADEAPAGFLIGTLELTPEPVRVEK